MDAELLFALDRLRRHFHMPVKITSAARCQTHNAAVHGHPHSFHLLGKAADFVVVGWPQDRALLYLNAVYPDRYGIGDYSSHLHLDIRVDKARWIKPEHV